MSLTDTTDPVFLSWLDEAERRDREMGEDPAAGAPADEVLRHALRILAIAHDKRRPGYWTGRR